MTEPGSSRLHTSFYHIDSSSLHEMLNSILQQILSNKYTTKSDSTLKVSVRDNGDEPSSLNQDSSRAFTHGGAPVPSKISSPREKGLISEISSLEVIEKKLAKKYKIPVDSVTVRQTAQERAADKFDADASREWSQMHTLYHRRKDLAHLRMFGYIELESSPTKPPSSIDPSRFWAVIIGIDDYDSHPLRGCASDAREIAEYLVHDLRIAIDHVRLLLSTSPWLPHARAVSTLFGAVGDEACIAPTRDNIVNTLLELSTDPRIEVGDNIIIYFSGHGSKYLCSEYLPYSGSHAGVGTIEALCPVDRSFCGHDGREIPDISDREINAILSEISRTKGQHITVILDCCYASSLTRAIQGEATVRTIKPMPSASTIRDMLQAADKRLRYLPGYRSVLAEDWFPNMDSHVVLAACKEYQFATEIKCDGGYHGVFTQGLNNALKSVTDGTTYFDLLQNLPSTVNQTPVIAGKHRDAKLWYQDSVSRDRIYITSSGDGITSGVRAG